MIGATVLAIAVFVLAAAAIIYMMGRRSGMRDERRAFTPFAVWLVKLWSPLILIAALVRVAAHWSTFEASLARGLVESLSGTALVCAAAFVLGRRTARAHGETHPRAGETSLHLTVIAVFTSPLIFPAILETANAALDFSASDPTHFAVGERRARAETYECTVQIAGLGRLTYEGGDPVCADACRVLRLDVRAGLLGRRWVDRESAACQDA